MIRIHLVRHGEPAAGWTEHRDPGLSEQGHSQARRAAERLAARGPLPILSSPLRRARETATAFENIWQRAALIDDRLTEIPAPDGGLADRGSWLQRVREQSWPALENEAILRWRARLIAWAESVETEVVAVSHFMAINVLIGLASADERLVCCNLPTGAWITLGHAHGSRSGFLNRPSFRILSHRPRSNTKF